MLIAVCSICVEEVSDVGIIWEEETEMAEYLILEGKESVEVVHQCLRHQIICLK